MARPLRQSTAVDIPVGPFQSPTDGSILTGLTITQPDVLLKKNGAAWAQKNAAQTLAHESNGHYEVSLDATDTNTLGLLRLSILETGALIVWEDFVIMEAAKYDALYGAGLLPVNVEALNTNTASAVNLRFSASTIVRGAAVTGTLSSTQMTTDLTEVTDGHYKRRVVLWTSGVLLGQATDITEYLGSVAPRMLTYTATATGESPSNGDTFVIV